MGSCCKCLSAVEVTRRPVLPAANGSQLLSLPLYQLFFKLHSLSHLFFNWQTFRDKCFLLAANTSGFFFSLKKDICLQNMDLKDSI